MTQSEMHKVVTQNYVAAKQQNKALFVWKDKSNGNYNHVF